jgi:hypothetical protein
MFLADLHCDTITTIMARGEHLRHNTAHISLDKFNTFEGVLQCFAIWLNDVYLDAPFLHTVRALNFFMQEKGNVAVMRTAADLDSQTLREKQTPDPCTLRLGSDIGQEVSLSGNSASPPLGALPPGPVRDICLDVLGFDIKDAGLTGSKRDGQAHLTPSGLGSKPASEDRLAVNPDQRSPGHYALRLESNIEDVCLDVFKTGRRRTPRR